VPLYQAIVLAVVQGLTEFLPVSSTAHLILFPWLFGWREPGLAFDVALHAGTLVAVILYFLRDWIMLVLSGLGLHYPRGIAPEEAARNRRLFWYLVAATVPAALVGYFGQHWIETVLRSTYVIAATMIGVGLLMAWAEAISALEKNINSVSLPDSLAVGVAQAFALVPGVSRSGITITAGLWRGMNREAAARFSFLLSTPIIAGAALVELPKLIRLAHAGSLDVPLSTVFIGIIVAAVVGYLGIAFFLRYLQTRTLKIFIYYRIIFGIVILLLLVLHWGATR